MIVEAETETWLSLAAVVARLPLEREPDQRGSDLCSSVVARAGSPAEVSMEFSAGELPPVEQACSRCISARAAFSRARVLAALRDAAERDES